MPATQTVRRSVAMTPQLRARLQQLLAKQGKEVTEADLIRQAWPISESGCGGD